MPVDNFKPKGPAKSAKSDSGGGNTKDYPVIGIVKDNIDPTRSGRIKVVIQDGKGPVDTNDSGSWITVQYLSTFFGSIGSTSGKDKEDYGNYKNNPTSYGQWQAPPDIGSKVVCIFINGDVNAGFYIGCIPEPETLQMVPAIGASDKVTLNEGESDSYGGATRLPVTNLNTNNKDKADSDQFLNTPRPVHSYTASIMSQQGIIRDPIRGPISSSASREAASRVGWGVATPGRPIYEGGYDDENLPDNLEQSKGEQLKVISRRGGHSIVMDDGDIIGRDQLVRIRTALGHQILMSDDGQTLMILHSNGQSYIELGKEGTVDIFSMNSINMRTQGDFNIHADRDINLHAMEKLNIQAKNIHVNSEEETKFRAGKDYRIESLNNYTVKAASAVALASGGESSMVAGGQAFINGSKVNLNSGQPGLKPATVPIVPLIAQTDTLFDKSKGWAAAPGKLLSIASRAPAHYPWANAGQGVDIKTSGNASDNLPAASSGAVQAVNNAAANTGAAAPNVATVASVPATNSVSPSVDKGTTGAVLGAVATTAASGPAAAATKAGAAVVNATAKSGGLVGAINDAARVVGQATQAVQEVQNITNQANSVVVAVGSFAQTPKQLEQSGILKPGAGELINGLATAGKSIVNAIPDNMFTGKAGAENVTALATNVVAQADSVVNVMQTAQKALGQAGVLTGKESSTQTAGIVTAAATEGVDKTVEVVKQASTLVTNATSTVNNITNAVATATNAVSAVTDITGAATNITGAGAKLASTASSITQAATQLNTIANTAGSVLKAVGAGNAAANLATSLGGLGGISNALKGMSGGGAEATLTGLLDSVKGVAGSAFSAIISSFPKLQPKVPQFLTDHAKQMATKAATEASKLAGSTNTKDTPSAIADAMAKDEAATNNSIDSITGAAQTATPTPAAIAAAISKDETATNNAISNITSEVQSVTGNLSGLTKNVNSAINTVNGLAGAAQTLTSGGLPSLATAAKSVQSGGGAAKASNLASGITNIPGGIQTVSSVLNKATGAINALPGTEKLSGDLANAMTQVSNGLTTAVNALNDVQNIATKAGGLASSIASKLPLGDASKLLSSLSALGAGGASPIKLPSIGLNTVNRAELTEQIKSVIGDPGIPKPNFVGEVSEGTISALEQKQVETKATLDSISKELDASIAEVNAAKAAYIEAARTLPAGDPALAAARKKFNDLTTKQNGILAKYVEAFDADERAKGDPLQGTDAINTGVPEELLTTRNG